MSANSIVAGTPASPKPHESAGSAGRKRAANDGRRMPVQQRVPEKKPAHLSTGQALSAVLALARAAIEAFAKAEDQGESADTGGRLLTNAEGNLHALVEVVRQSPLTMATARAWLNQLAEIQSFTEGALALDKRSNKARALAASTALEALEAMTYTLDVPYWPDESYDQYVQRNFMAGMGLFADLMTKAQEIAPTGKSELEARLRGRDVAQEVFVCDYIDRMVRDASLREGFMAALSGLLTITETGSTPDPEFFRGLTVEDCFGGPGINYDGEEAEAAPSAAPEAAGAAQAASSQRGGDLSPAQVRHVLEEIATSANVLRGFAYNAGQDPDGNDTYMMAAMAERIGQLADFAGAGCVGGPAAWMLGPNFRSEGARHG